MDSRMFRVYILFFALCCGCGQKDHYSETRLSSDKSSVRLAHQVYRETLLECAQQLAKEIPAINLVSVNHPEGPVIDNIATTFVCYGTYSTAEMRRMLVYAHEMTLQRLNNETRLRPWIVYPLCRSQCRTEIHVNNPEDPDAGWVVIADDGKAIFEHQNDNQPHESIVESYQDAYKLSHGGQGSLSALSQALRADTIPNIYNPSLW